MTVSLALSITRAALALSVPTAIVLIYFIETGNLTFGDAFLGWMATTALLTGVCYRHYTSLNRFEVVVSKLEETSPEDELLSIARQEGQISDLARAITRHGRWLNRQRESLSQGLETVDRILNNLPDPIIRFDSETRIVGINRAAQLLFGKKCMGKELIRVIRNPDVGDAVRAALTNGRASLFELPITGQVDRIYTARVHRIDDGAPDGSAVVLVMQDLTRVQLAERMRGDFVANASHELRTPLSTLLGFIETIRGPAKGDPEAQEHFLEIMQQQTERMSRLVEDLLSLSRVELAELTPPTQRVDMPDLLHKVKATLDLKAGEKGVSLDILAKTPRRHVIGDSDQLNQVFQNLIDNAIKYGRADSTVTVEIKEPEVPPPSFPRTAQGILAITITDQGEGIPREHLSRLTERFYRVDKARSRDLGGTGLGLAIVKHIISRHKGALVIDSEIGTGSSFTVFLPAV